MVSKLLARATDWMIGTGTKMRKTREELNGRIHFRLSVKSFISELLFLNCLLDIVADTQGTFRYIGYKI